MSRKSLEKSEKIRMNLSGMFPNVKRELLKNWVETVLTGSPGGPGKPGLPGSP